MTMQVASSDALIFADREGRIQLWNEAAERLFGFTAEQAMGQSLDIVIPKHLRARHWAGYRMAMERGATKYPGRPVLTKGLHRSGATLYAETSLAVVQAPRKGRSRIHCRRPRAARATGDGESGRILRTSSRARSRGEAPVVPGPGCARRRTR